MAAGSSIPAPDAAAASLTPARRVPYAFARTHGVLPLRDEGDAVLVLARTDASVEGIAELKRGIHQSVVALLTARRSRIKVKDIPMAAFVIINTVEHLTHAAELASYSARDLAQLERELNDFILAYLVGREN